MTITSRQLEPFGLSGNRARVFAALLKLGRATTIQLAKETRLKRTTVYEVILDLLNEGFATETKRGKRRLFTAEDPQLLQGRFEEKLQEIKKTLPLLAEAYGKVVPKPNIRFYDGVHGVRTIMEEMLRMKDKEMLSWSAVSDLVDLFGEHYIRSWLRRRIRRGIWSRVLHPAKSMPLSKRYLETSDTYLRKSRRLPEGVSFDGMLCVFDDKVAYLSSRNESFGFIIESAALSKMLRQLFEITWATTQ